MKITDALLGEHALLYGLLDHFQAPPASLEVQHMFGQTLEATLASHAEIEDRLLFTALEPHLDPNHGPLAVMRLEHEQIERAVEQSLTLEDPSAGQALFAHIANLARSHFAKEEQILFPLAEQVLSAQRLQSLGELWATERGVILAALPMCD